MAYPIPIFVYGFHLSERVMTQIQWLLEEEGSYVLCQETASGEALCDPEDEVWHEGRVSTAYAGNGPIPYWIGVKLSKARSLSAVYDVEDLLECVTFTEKVQAQHKEEFKRSHDLTSEEYRALVNLCGEPRYFILFGTT
jgi:hypothetical protein